MPFMMQVFPIRKERRDEIPAVAHVDDMAAASLFVLELDEESYQTNTKPMLSHINVGTGVDVTIREMAETMKHVVGF